MFLNELSQTPNKKLNKLNSMLVEQFGIRIKHSFPNRKKLYSLLEHANMAILKLRDSNKLFQLDPEYAKFLGMKDAIEIMIGEGMYAESPRYMEMKQMLESTVCELMDMGYTVDEATAECMNRYRMDSRFAYDDEYVLPLVVTVAKKYMDEYGKKKNESKDSYEMSHAVLLELAKELGVKLKDSSTYKKIEKTVENFARTSGKSREAVIEFLNGLDEAALLPAIRMFGRKIAESNAFVKARRDAILDGKKEFEVDGKMYKVTGDTSDEVQSMKESNSMQRDYKCVHAKKGTVDVKADSAYAAAKKAAEKWGLKSTAGIDAHLLDVAHTPTESAVNEGMSNTVPIQKGDIFKHKYSPNSIEIVQTNYRMTPVARLTNWVKYTSSNDYMYMTDDKIRKEYKRVEDSVSEGMPSTVAKRKQRFANMSDSEFASSVAHMSDDQLRSLAWSHGYGKNSDQYLKRRQNAQSKDLNENVNVDEAEVVMASRALIDDIQDQVERLGRIMNENLPAIVDKMRTEMGAQAAYGFGQSMNQILSTHLEATKLLKQNMDNLVGKLTGEGDVEDVAMGDTNFDASEDELAQSDQEDELDVNEPAAAGPEQSPLGRAEI
jgi:hypothetical protein